MHATSTRQLLDLRIGAAAAAAAAAIFTAGIAFGTWISPGAALVGSPVTVPVGDRSYDAVEETRADRGLSIQVGDGSYDAVEETRADRGLSTPAGFPSAETRDRLGGP